MAGIALFGMILIFAYLFFYINSRQYLRRENFADTGINVSWPGGVVSPPPFSASLRGY